MKLRRIEIENFRKLIGPVVIDGIADTVTVVCGDNEEGKSTVLHAIQTAFFVRHRVSGVVADQLQPYGRDVRPQVTVEFERDGGTYRLRKAFRQRPEAELQTPNHPISLTGDAVEEELQRLLAYRPPGRETGRMENRGILGLFWVQQGTTFHGLTTDDQARQSLLGCFEGELETVLGGRRGQILRQRIRARRDELLTKAGKPRNAYAAALDERDQRQATVVELEQRLAGYETEIDRLASIEERLRRHEANHSLASARAALAEAQQNHERLARLRQAEKEAQQTLRLAKSQLEAPTQRLQLRRAETERLDELQQACDAAAQHVHDAQELLRRCDADVEGAEQRLAEANARRTASEHGLRDAEARERRDGAEKRRREVLASLEAARQARGALATAQAAQRANRVTDARIAHLRELDLQRLQAESRASAAATQIRLAPDPGRVARRDGQSVDATAPLEIAAPTTITLEGWGTMDVRPGGDGLDAARSEAISARDALLGALRDAGIASMEEAERAHRKWAADAAAAREQSHWIAVYAPAGIEALEAELQSAAAALDALPASAAASDTEAVSIAALRDLASETIDAERAAADALAASRAARANARNAVERHAGEQLVLDRQIAAAAAALRETRDQESDAALESHITDLRRNLAAAHETWTAHQNALVAIDATTVELRLVNARSAVDVIQQDVATLTTARTEARARLEALGSHGLGEQLEDARAHAEAAAADAARYERDANALRLLDDTLRIAEAEAKDRFLAPVRARIEPYLRRVFRDSRLTFDAETLHLTGMERGGIEEPFEGLSLGTREQVAVLARLAFAELVAESGAPALVILDDALVYSDPQRLEDMLLAIRQASQHVQVIILTCRESDYHALGAPLIRLESCRARSPAA